MKTASMWVAEFVNCPGDDDEPETTEQCIARIQRDAWEAGRDAAAEVAHDWCNATCPDTLRELEEERASASEERAALRELTERAERERDQTRAEVAALKTERNSIAGEAARLRAKVAELESYRRTPDQMAQAMSRAEDAELVALAKCDELSENLALAVSRRREAVEAEHRACAEVAALKTGSR